MEVKIQRAKAIGQISAPPSKSYAHRLLIASALANGKSRIEGIVSSSDMKATINCIRALGVSLEQRDRVVSVNGGIRKGTSFDCLESGSTLRFFIPISLIFDTECTFFGTERLMSRGLDVYFDLFKEQGIEYKLEKTSLHLKGKLRPAHFKIRGDISSQFITGLLFALPLLDGDSTIEITTRLESEPYVDITLEVLSRFGIEIQRKNNSFYIKGNQSYLPQSTVVEGDASNSAFLDAFNVIGGEVSVLGLNESTILLRKST